MEWDFILTKSNNQIQTEVYYEARMPYFEDTYLKESTSKDRELIKIQLKKHLCGKRILEVGCGTGYWTSVMLPIASEYLGFDQSQTAVSVCSEKFSDFPNTNFLQGNIYSWVNTNFHFDVIVGGFIISHLDRKFVRDINTFLKQRIKENCWVVWYDNSFKEGFSIPIKNTDVRGNDIQPRQLENGKRCKIIKNFYNENELREIFSKESSEFSLLFFDHYWFIKYRLQAG